jgi:ubiquinone/menaquinone biosynthesis C-methylase UbiE
MIEQAKSKKLPHTDFIVGDCENLPFAEQCHKLSTQKKNIPSFSKM